MFTQLWPADSWLRGKYKVVTVAFEADRLHHDEERAL